MTGSSKRNLRPYPKYKDACCEWIDQIPATWRGLPLKRCVATKITDGPHETPELCDEGIEFISAEAVQGDKIDFNLRRGFISQQLHEQYIRKCRPARNDILMCKSGATTGKLAMVEDDREFSVWSPLALIRAKQAEVSPRFLFSALRADYVQKQIQRTWSAGTQPNIAMGAIEQLHILLPSCGEQDTIAAFLDRETARIDALVAKKRRLIELLEEKRAALITRAVTKGLDTNVPMKDSGLKWMGSIPSHWTQKRIKHLLDRIIDTEHKTAPFFPDGRYLVVRTSDIRSGRLIMENAKYTDEEGYTQWTRRGKPSPGDILFTREAPAGEACLVPASLPLCLGQRVVLFRPRGCQLDSRFGVYAIYGGLADAFIKTLSQGSTVAHFNMSDIGSIPLLCPPIREQQEIADALDLACGRIDALRDRVERGIANLDEYRCGLISAAVTGKIDIRDAAYC